MKTLHVIVPYRDRAAHLRKFDSYMPSWLPIVHPGIKFQILYVEQGDLQPFNRGALLNIGVHHVLKTNSPEEVYFCTHDIDMIPLKSDYTLKSEPTHLAGRVEQFQYRMPYKSYFGGVVVFSAEDFIKADGYPNNYWGWGAEDDAFLIGMYAAGITPMWLPGKYNSLPHDRIIDQKLLQLNHQQMRRGRKRGDGYSGQRYYEKGEKTLSQHSKMITVCPVKNV